MRMGISADTTSLSVEGVEYEVQVKGNEGIVELPDNLPPTTVKALIEGHGMSILPPEEPELKKAKKAEE